MLKLSLKVYFRFSIFNLCSLLHFYIWQYFILFFLILQLTGLAGKISNSYSLVVLFDHMQNEFQNYLENYERLHIF